MQEQQQASKEVRFKVHSLTGCLSKLCRLSDLAQHSINSSTSEFFPAFAAVSTTLSYLLGAQLGT